MTKLTPELKKRFYAQYYGVKAFSSTKHQILNLESSIIYPELTSFEGGFLNLRPITQITDEQAIEVAKIVWPIATNLHEANEGREYVSWDSGSFNLNVSDYLRSIGVAIAFMGISVEEMVKEGWIKLQEL